MYLWENNDGDDDAIGLRKEQVRLHNDSIKIGGEVWRAVCSLFKCSQHHNHHHHHHHSVFAVHYYIAFLHLGEGSIFGTIFGRKKIGPKKQAIFGG